MDIQIPFSVVKGNDQVDLYLGESFVHVGQRKVRNVTVSCSRFKCVLNMQKKWKENNCHPKLFLSFPPVTCPRTTSCTLYVMILCLLRKVSPPQPPIEHSKQRQYDSKTISNVKSCKFNMRKRVTFIPHVTCVTKTYSSKNRNPTDLMWDHHNEIKVTHN